MRIPLLIVAFLVSACVTADSGARTVDVLQDCTPGTHDSYFRGQPVRIHVPQAAVQQRQLPAVMVLHGSEDDGRFVAQQTQFAELGETEGFLTVFPTAPNGNWQLSRSGVTFIDSLAASVSCADPRRFYLAGFSRGSAMTFRVACTSPKRRFAAFAGVAFPDYLRACDQAKPAPWIYFHGTKDMTVSYTDGYLRGSGRMTPPAKPAMRKWAVHNGCRLGPRIKRIGDDVILRRYTVCRGRAAVKFYTILGGDHQWPFQNRPNAPLLSRGQSWASVGATYQMWHFFKRRELPAAS